ncbi:CBS domain-containing protein [Streptomyces sp. NPDC018031]|uniref:CBS domain-containing protein n=1 Tax=Streptomyces sp. NPDC018031 TaxID=3365033 RepID=UPI00378F6730
MPDQSRYTVSDVMTLTVVAVGRQAPFKEIARTMAQWDVSAVPVLEGEGRVVGVVSEADLLPVEASRYGAAEAVTEATGPAAPAGPGVPTAEGLMTAPAVTVPAGATLAQAARVMAVHRVKRLPVVDDAGMLQGVISRGDLLKVFLRPDEELAEEVREAVVAPLFAALRGQVTVAVEDGVVTLDGHAVDSALLALAVRLARTVEGVVDARARLVHGPDPRAAKGAGGAEGTG